VRPCSARRGSRIEDAFAPLEQGAEFAPVQRQVEHQDEGRELPLVLVVSLAFLAHRHRVVGGDLARLVAAVAGECFELGRQAGDLGLQALSAAAGSPNSPCSCARSPSSPQP
jgi:hypothetical protein